MMSRRRLSLGLTPLLDLLLIVIFAQFLDVREIEQATRDDAAQAEAERETLASEFAALKQTAQQVAAAKERAETAAQRLRQENETLQRDIAQLQSNLDETFRSQRRIGGVLREMFRLPEDILAQLTDRNRDSVLLKPSDEREQLLALLQSMAEAEPEDVLLHLISYGEIRNHVDVWRLHIDAGGVARLSTDERVLTFRVVPDRFVIDFLRVARSLPETKDLVVVLFSYGNARLSVIEGVRNRLPEVMAAIKENSSRRFEFAELGYQPDEASLPRPIESLRSPPNEAAGARSRARDDRETSSGT